MPNVNTCCLCNDEFTHGNNALPILDAKCCNDCNLRVVIPARIKALFDQKLK